jgi:hypothetical protein
VIEVSSVKLQVSDSGRHRVFVTSNQSLVVEWYDFGDVPYETANTLTFYAVDQAKLARALGVTEVTAHGLQSAIAERFATYWDIRAFCDQHCVTYRHDVDAMP